MPNRSHATAVLAQICGSELGVAKDVWPALYNFDYENGYDYLIEALDHIYTDFLTTGVPSSPNGARLSVLNMSFGMVVNTNTAFIAKLSASLKRLIDIGVLPVVSAGNDAVVSYINLRKASPQTTTYE